MPGCNLRDLRQGGEDAWREAFRILWPIALSAAAHAPVALRWEEVEDAANEALAQLVHRVDSVRSFDELRALAATIAYRRAVSAARRDSAAKRIPAVAMASDLANQLNEVAADVECATGRLDDVQLAELALLLHRALHGLDADTRGMLLAKVCEGLTYRELAQRYRKPEPTVTARVSRGLAAVRSRLARLPVLMHELRSFLR